PGDSVAGPVRLDAVGDLVRRLELGQAVLGVRAEVAIDALGADVPAGRKDQALEPLDVRAGGSLSEGGRVGHDGLRPARLRGLRGGWLAERRGHLVDEGVPVEAVPGVGVTPGAVLLLRE